MVKRKVHLVVAMFVLIVILIIGLIYLFGISGGKGTTSIKEFSVTPQIPIAGQSATVKISLSDSKGIKGFELEVKGFDLKKTFSCNNEITCEKEFSYTIPNKDLNKVTLILTVLNSEGQKTSKKKEVVIRKSDDEPKEAVCGDDICSPSEDETSCSKDCTAFKGPENLFDMNEMFDESSLNTQITGDKIVTTSLGTLRAIDVKYYVTNWRGVDIYNTGTIYIPENMPEANKGKAAIMEGYSKDVQTGPDFLEDFAQNTAIILGVPVYACSCGYPPGPFGYDSESQLSQAFKTLMLEDNDLTRNVVVPLTQDYMRAMTMLNSFDEAGNPTEFVTTGSSKRGNTQWTLAAVDSRVKGFMSNAFAGPDQINYWELVEQEFGGENLYGTSDEALPWLNTWSGKQYQYYFDPYQFTEKLEGKVSMTNVGTNDREPIQTLNSLFLKLDEPKALEFVADYPHGWGSKQHLANWRSIIDRTFFGRKTPIVSVNNNGDVIEATVSNAESINKVRLFYGTNYNSISDDLTRKEGEWFEVEMQKDGTKYVASKSVLPQDESIAYYIEVEDERNDIQSYSSSIVYIIER
ncbi:hypothetical protein J4438_02270 [Candidatus Woesearchaeota archaeon]|nr:hypothetical protein [Candidatus Woesearchaeota archaeon]